jgi:hypothetical protein
MVLRTTLVLLLIISVVSILSYGEASAKDMNMLVDTLASNFLAQQVSTICSAGDKQFDSETSGALGDAGRYSERVRQEVVTGFSSDEATEIISKAASKARGEALQLIGRFSPGGQVDQVKLGEWCRTTGRAFVRRLASIYDEHHSDFERELNNAKR